MRRSSLAEHANLSDNLATILNFKEARLSKYVKAILCIQNIASWYDWVALDIYLIVVFMVFFLGGGGPDQIWTLSETIVMMHY